MTDFSENFSASAWDMLISMFGEAVSYTAGGGAAATITAIVRRGGGSSGGPASETRTYDDGRLNRKFASAAVNKSDVAAPAVSDTIVIDTLTYVVEEIVNEDANIAVLRLSTADSVEKAHDRHYARRP